jgi:hypothetical protein
MTDAIKKTMDNSVSILRDVCDAISREGQEAGAAILRSKLPFEARPPKSRKYTGPAKCIPIFFRDGFIDRYSGAKLVFPGTLRLLSELFKDEFPYHLHWRTDACHWAYYELSPTVDHKVPITRCGTNDPDDPENLMTTSQLNNSAKANFLIEELCWTLHPKGNPQEWDGLTSWFVNQIQHTERQSNKSLAEWYRAAKISLRQYGLT